MIFIPGEDWSPPDLAHYQPAWAAMAGYDTTFWQEPGKRYYREGLPELGIEAPIEQGDFAPGTRVWLRYETAWGHDNGEWRSAEEIAQVAVVRGIVEQAPPGSPTPHIVTPQYIHTLADLWAMEPYPAEEDFWGDNFGRVFATCIDSNRMWTQALAPYRYWNFDLESEVGMWLIAREERGVLSVLMCGQWTLGARFFYAGHRRLSDAESSRLREGSG